MTSDTVFIAAGSSTKVLGASWLYSFHSLEDATGFVRKAQRLAEKKPQYIANQAGAIEWSIYPCALNDVDVAFDHLLTHLKGD